MDYTQKDTKTIFRTVIIGAIGLVLANVWNTTIIQIINTIYPIDELDKEKNKYKRIAAHLVYAVVVTILAIVTIKLVFV